MYGELHIKPWELRRYTFRDVLLAIDGLRDKDLLNQLYLRRSTFIIASAYGGKKVAAAIGKLWPVEGVKKEDWVSKAKKLLAHANEYDDRKKVRRMLKQKEVSNG